MSAPTTQAQQIADNVTLTAILQLLEVTREEVRSMRVQQSRETEEIRVQLSRQMEEVKEEIKEIREDIHGVREEQNLLAMQFVGVLGDFQKLGNNIHTHVENTIRNTSSNLVSPFIEHVGKIQQRMDGFKSCLCDTTVTAVSTSVVVPPAPIPVDYYEEESSSSVPSADSPTSSASSGAGNSVLSAGHGTFGSHESK